MTVKQIHICDFCDKEVSDNYLKIYSEEDIGVRINFGKIEFYLDDQDFCSVECFIGFIRRKFSKVNEKSIERECPRCGEEYGSLNVHTGLCRHCSTI